MKKIIISLGFLLQMLTVQGQYDITVNQISTVPPRFECNLISTAVPADYDDQDLITWIFPDGQFFQQEMEVDPISKTPINNSTRVIWQPYQDAPGGGNAPIAYVAKKGQPGNPPKRVAPTTVTGLFSGSPASFAMPPTASWQFNRSWEFAPGTENFMIVSYKTNSACGNNNNIQLTFDPNELDVISAENLNYENETIDQIPVSLTKKTVKISGIDNSNNTIKHLFLKFLVSPAVGTGKALTITANGTICGKEINETLRYVANGTPHDPNHKIVNRPVICSQTPYTTDLIYYVRFQNEGNAPVMKVDVEDKLKYPLISSSFSEGIIPRKSAVYLGHQIAGNKVLMQFDNLNLPGLKQVNPHYAYDQTTYDFTFNVCTESNLGNAVFTNQADIYFFNAGVRLPVVKTNEAPVIVRIDTCYKSTADCIVAAAEPSFGDSDLKIAPNPVDHEIQVSVKLAETSYIRAVLRNLHGSVVAQWGDSTLYEAGLHSFRWICTTQPSGIYWLELQTNRGRVVRKVLKI